MQFKIVIKEYHFQSIPIYSLTLFINHFLLRNDDINVLLKRTRITSINPIAVWILPKSLKIDELIGKCQEGEDLLPCRGV